MTNSFYLPAASTVKVMIRGIDLDLTFRLDWKESQPKVPIYGYNDIEYTKTIPGRKLIQGFLVMNYIAPHYLSAILENWDRTGKLKEKADFDQIMEELPGTESATLKAARAEMLASRLFSKDTSEEEETTYGPIKELAKKGSPSVTDAAQNNGLLNTPGVGDGSFKQLLIDRFILSDNPIVPKIAGPGEYTTPFDMAVYHMEPEFSNWYVLLEGVEITDVSQTISAAGSEGSSDPLYETYQFIARSRTIKEVK
jgi:hypothetical protein